MKFRRSTIALATVLALALGLPTLGRAVGIYSLRFEVVARAYASLEGACGHANASTGPDATRFLTVCFGETLDVRSFEGNNRGSVSRVSLWIHDFGCNDDECFDRVSYGFPHEVATSVDPLLGTASVDGTSAGEECIGPIDLTLTALGEPGVRANPQVAPPFVDLQPDQGQLDVTIGGAASVGRDATMSGTVCGLTFAPETYPTGRIFRGLGSEGSSIKISYV